MNFAYKHKNMFDSVFWLQAQTEDALRQSLVRSAKRIPRDQISEKSRRANPADASEQQEIIDEVLEWLGQEGNSNWLLVFDNIDLDPNSAEDRKRGAFKVADYLPASQGSILITSRLETLSQIGGGRSREEVAMVGYELSKRIFEHWSGQTLGEIPDRFMHIAATDPLKMMMTTRRNFSVQRGSAVSLLQWRRLRCMSSRIPECLLRSIYAVLTRCGPKSWGAKTSGHCTTTTVQWEWRGLCPWSRSVTEARMHAGLFLSGHSWTIGGSPMTCSLTCQTS